MKQRWIFHWIDAARHFAVSELQPTFPIRAIASPFGRKQ
jgi:hypothetical protein